MASQTDSNEDQKLPHDSASHHLSLDQNLSGDGSKRVLNLMNWFVASSSSESSDGNELKPLIFSCNYCQRKFDSSQALGGHQNAHKRERALLRGGQKVSAIAAVQVDIAHRYSSMVPQLESVNNTDPSYQILTTGLYPSSLCQNDWPRQRQPIHDSQQANGKLPSGNYFHVGAETGSSFAGGIPRSQNFLQNLLTEGIGTHRLGSVTLLENKQEELQKLDLSLKL